MQSSTDVFPEEVTMEQSGFSNSVSVKIPQFWQDKPEIWFYQVEAQFTISNITVDKTKFNYLVSQLDPKIIEHIWDIIGSNEPNKYLAAKERLLSSFGESDEKRIKKLLTGISLGDLKPSQLLRKMKSLAGENITEKVLRTLWMDKLPDSVKNILIVSNESLDNLALMADKIFEMNPITEVYSATSDSTVMDKVLEKISFLEQQISALSVERQSRSAFRQATSKRNRSRSKSKKQFKPDGKYCYYHFKFGNRCYPNKCVSPCSWKNQENSNQQ